MTNELMSLVPRFSSETTLHANNPSVASKHSAVNTLESRKTPPHVSLWCHGAQKSKSHANHLKIFWSRLFFCMYDSSSFLNKPRRGLCLILSPNCSLQLKIAFMRFITCFTYTSCLDLSVVASSCRLGEIYSLSHMVRRVRK